MAVIVVEHLIYDISTPETRRSAVLFQENAAESSATSASVVYACNASSVSANDFVTSFQTPIFQVSAFRLFMQLCQLLLEAFDLQHDYMLSTPSAEVHSRVWVSDRSAASHHSFTASLLNDLATRIQNLDEDSESFQHFHRILSACLSAGIPLAGALMSYGTPAIRREFLEHGVLASTALRPFQLTDQYPTELAS